MPSRKEEYQRIGAERLEAERESTRELRRDLVRSSLQMAAWCLAGLVVMFFSFRIDDLILGRGLLYGGMAVGYAGIAYTILAAYRRGEKRGDW